MENFNNTSMQYANYVAIYGLAASFVNYDK